MKIFVLGYTGMLGRYVYTYFKSKSYNVIGLSRKDLDAANIKKEDLSCFTNESVIINCMGVINSRKDISNLEFIQVNSIFPHILSDVCKETGSKLIHVTTDCFLPTTKVITKKCVKTINTVKVGDLVYTHKGELKSVYELKKKTINEGVLRIKTRSNRPVTCTKKHPFYGIKRKKKQKPNFNSIQWLLAKDLEEGDLLAIPKLKLPRKNIDTINLLNYSNHYKSIIEEYKHFESHIKDVVFDNFKKYCADKDLNYRKMLEWKYNPERRPTVYDLIKLISVNEKVSWFLGLFLADGWVDNSNHRKVIHITIEDEVNIIRKTIDVIKEEFKITPNIRYIENQKSCEIYFTHQLLSEMLAKTFYNSTEHYSHTKNIPQWIRNIGRENIISFLKGYFEGDGCFYENEEDKKSCFFSATSVSESLVDELEVLLLFLDILPARFFVEKTEMEKIQNRIVKVRNQHVLSISGKQVEKLLIMFNKQSLYYNSVNRHQKFFEDKKNWYVPVTSVEEKRYKGFVYNLEVRDDHSYLVSGGLSAHNCVYDGLDGNYDELFKHNANDMYGITKSLGEPVDTTIIRTSIIGEELNQSRSLLEWIKFNKGKKILGYTNHIWNGVTCLQFAKVCKYIIDNKLFWHGVKHVYSPKTLTKYELVKLISKIYDLDVKVSPYKTETVCDRTLTSIRNEIVLDIPELETQLIEMKGFLNYNNREEGNEHT